MSAGVLAKGTMKNYYTTQRYMREFVKKKYRRSEYCLSELNYKFILDLEIFLRNHQPADHQKPLTNNGIIKHLERLKKMINLAFDRLSLVADVTNMLDSHRYRTTTTGPGYVFSTIESV